MTDRNVAELPLEAAAGAAGPHAVEAFKRLADEARLAILLALWEAHEPFGDGGTLAFSELRRRVDYDTSGNFSYHLQRLEGQFVESTGDGYRLTRAGHKLVRAVIAGTGFADTTLERTEIGMDCVQCGASLAITYRNGQLYTVCTGCEGRFADDDRTPHGTIMWFAFDPAGLSHRSAEETFAASIFRAMQKFTMQMGGLCPDCSGPVEGEMDVCDDHDPDGVCANCGRRDRLQARWVCTVCKNAGHGPPDGNVIVHPRVLAFYANHGFDIGYDTNDFAGIVRALRAMADNEAELVSRDPLRVRVTVRYGGDRLRLVVDEAMHVVGIED
jgi:hypothetical protein